jgi:hypothetical protein
VQSYVTACGAATIDDKKDDFLIIAVKKSFPMK